MPLASQPSDTEFVDTEQDLPLARRGRADTGAPVLRLFGCGCGRNHLQRIRRSAWMRLLPLLRLYQCLLCGRCVLRPRMRQRPGYSAAFLQDLEPPRHRP